jgi:ribosomal protein S18 acetylase RimI-like enzyme
MPVSRVAGTRLRPAKTADVPIIQAQVTSAYTKYIERIGKPPAPMLADYYDLMQSHQIYVLCQDETSAIVGSIVLGLPQGSSSVDINNLVVDPSQQGRGFGKALMMCAEDVARDNSRTSLDLYTNVKMYENFALYNRMGFKEIGRRTESGYERVYFKKDLTWTKLLGRMNDTE